MLSNSSLSLSPMAMELVVEAKRDQECHESNYMKGVKHLCENGITRVPSKYILPLPDRPIPPKADKSTLRLPVIDLAQLHTSGRPQLLDSLSNACSEYGFFRVVNHGICGDDLRRIIDVGRRFFELPFEERARFMSPDIKNPVRYGTSFNQMNDGVFCWRDFLKLSCHPINTVLPHWPSSPIDMREEVITYAMKAKGLFLVLMGAILETLGLKDNRLHEFNNGTHMTVLNCYPVCPEPGLTLGMLPHSDYGFLTILLQDEVEGLQVQCGGEWLTVEPVTDSFVVNVGDHLEIFSNGKYKSVLHRVLVNSVSPRMSVASLHSLPHASTVSPAAELNTEENPRVYKDTNFAAFLDYLVSCETKEKSFLETLRLTQTEKLDGI